MNTLPAYPASREDYEVWSAWSAQLAEKQRAPKMHDVPPREHLDDFARYVTGLRAVLSHWAKQRTVSPDDATLSAHHFLVHAHSAPPLVFVAAKNLFTALVDAGSTSSDVMFLTAAFAWPLRDVDPVASTTAWNYMIYAPWQTDAPSLKDMLVAVDAHRALTDGRSLMDLVRARERAGSFTSARELLEAVVLIQARRRHLERLQDHREFILAPLVHEGHQALVHLAERYRAQRSDQVHAREVMKRAAELTRDFTLVDAIEQTVWDRPLNEAYQWSAELVHQGQLDREIKRALDARQPHHARRLAEAVIVRRLHRFWYGEASEHVDAAVGAVRMKLLAGEVPADPVGRRAVEHVATLYVRTHHITQSARHLVHAVAGSIAFTGEGAALKGARSELERFYNYTDPYHIMARASALLDDELRPLSEDELRASDEVKRWFSTKFRVDDPTSIDRAVRWLTAPLLDAARTLGDQPAVERSLAAALSMVRARGPEFAGDLTAISKHASLIRAEYGHGQKLMDYAVSVTRPDKLVAAAIAAATSFLPPGMALAKHSSDLGASLVLAYRAIARVGAVFGRSLEDADGFQLVADSFALGLSSADGEGLVTSWSRQDTELLTPITIGAVGYGAARLVEYLWVAPYAEDGTRRSERLVQHVARLCSMELTRAGAARAVPILGAVLSGLSTYMFIDTIADAAIHVAARDALMERAHVYEGA
ncbi:MAG: hypothetical protein AAGI01_03410 [Myxococcota bacterium]